MDLSKLSTSEKVIAGSGLVLFIASFLPWFSVDFGPLGSADGNGWDVGFLWGGIPALLGLAAAGILVATRLGSAKLPDPPVPWPQLFLGAGVVAAVLVVLKLLLGHDELGIDLDREWGLYLAALASLAFAVGGYLHVQEERGAAGGPAR